MKIYNLPLTIENIEIFYFKKFKLPSQLKKIKSNDFYECLLESISNDMFYIFKINDNYYSTSNLEFGNDTIKESELFILNIPNIYINDNQISYVVNILHLTNFTFEKNVQYQYNDIYIFSNKNKIIDNLKGDSLKIINIDKLDIKNDNSIYDIVINNKNTFFIGLNPNTQILLNNYNITNQFLNRLFQLLKIISIVDKFYSYDNLYIINSDDDEFSNDISIYTIYNKNIKNIKIKDIIDIIEILKKNNCAFHI
jgi:hypothetical protein